MRFTAASVLAFAAAATAQNTFSAETVAAIAPGSVACDGSADCRTAVQAADHIYTSMFRYGVWPQAAIASVIALMAFESGDFKYKTNVYPGRPGQGTANMQMAHYNLLYAQSIPELAGQVGQFASVDGLSDEQLNQIRSLVTVDEYNFGSGAWFLATQCDTSIISQYSSDPEGAFQNHMACVGVVPDEGRLQYWARAKAAVGL